MAGKEKMKNCTMKIINRPENAEDIAYSFFGKTVDELVQEVLRNEDGKWDGMYRPAAGE